MNNTEGLLIYASMVENFRALKETNPEWALEYMSALIDYSFDGVVYEGNNIAIKMALNSEMVMIDNQRIRYNKAVKGGSAQKVTDEQILEAFSSQEFKNVTEAARYIATNYAPDGKFSRQALTKRLESIGLSFEELSSQNPQPGCENSATAQRNVSNLQRNVNNPTYTNTNTFTDTGDWFAQSATANESKRKSRIDGLIGD